jgi:hypothetical protein
MRSWAIAVQISRSEALEATISSSGEKWGLNVIGKFPFPLHVFVNLTSLVARLSCESASLIKSAGSVEARNQKKDVRLYLVSILIRSDQHLCLCPGRSY